MYFIFMNIFLKLLAYVEYQLFLLCIYKIPCLLISYEHFFCRHEDVQLLEKMKQLVLFIERKLDKKVDQLIHIIILFFFFVIYEAQTWTRARNSNILKSRVQGHAKQYILLLLYINNFINKI